MGFCEMANEDKLPIFWKEDMTNCTKTGGAQQLERRLQETANRISLPTPIISLAIAADILMGRVGSGGVDQVTPGLSIFRIFTHGTNDASHTDLQSLLYNLLNSGPGGATIDASAIMLRNKDIPVINHDLDFISTIQAYYVLLLTVLGAHSQVTQSYPASLLPHVEELANIIQMRSFQDHERQTIYMKVLHLNGGSRTQTARLVKAHSTTTATLDCLQSFAPETHLRQQWFTGGPLVGNFAALEQVAPHKFVDPIQPRAVKPNKHKLYGNYANDDCINSSNKFRHESLPTSNGPRIRRAQKSSSIP
jgi:hypothetical protein